MHGSAPVWMLGQHDRQLDHLRGLDLGGRGAEQHIAAVARVGVRRRREFDNAGRLERGQHLERKVGSGLVSLVHDHQRTVKGHQVDERKFEAAVLGTF